VLAPGAARVGAFYIGPPSGAGQHNDWYLPLEPGRCYTILANGGPGVDALYLYLWGPNGKRATDRREGRPNAALSHCASQPGMYHFQVKVAGGHGEYRAGVYAAPAH
jgi:hypothetical protein